MKGFRLLLIFCCLAVSAVCGPYAFGSMSVEIGGKWPGNWPRELERLRFKASTGHFVSSSRATYYYIPFDTRAEFERAWPALLRLKSKGAPISLRTVDAPKTNPNDRRVLHSGPKVEVVCPASGSYYKTADGRYAHYGEWSGDIKPLLSNGVLPRFVGRASRENADARWVIVNPDDPNSGRYVPYERARVELTVYVDSNVIDLNRIRLPENTPIRDNRKFTTDLQDPNLRPLPFTFSIIQRRSLHLPGFDKKVRMTIGDITGGHVMVTISGRRGPGSIAMRSIRPKDVISFSVDGRLYKLRLQKLTNYLLGNDEAQFQLWAVDESQAWLSEDAKIEELIVTLRRLKGAKFVRNDREYSADEAADHLKAKWQLKKSDIVTAEDFIRLVGSKSSVTGVAYMIKSADGIEISLEDWLGKQLAEIER